MTDEFRFTCSVCGELHEGLPDFAFDAPIHYHQIPETERSRRCYKTHDLCVIDDRDFFVRGVLYVPIRDTALSFGWGIWSSLSQSNFTRYIDLGDSTDVTGEGPWFGWLSNRIPSYPDTLNLKLKILLQGGHRRPHFIPEPTEHPLSLAHYDGIGIDEATAIAERLLHPPGPAGDQV